MRHASIQVRSKMTKEELERYENLFEVGKFLETQNRYDLAYTVQREVDTLILPAIERLKEGSKERDRLTQDFIEQQDEE
ncbi:hypothetical protein [Ammoniphilus sp. 3BR4]|uniref:hypothetical protein n=1 Tax=Ammoniphilus sp. 3BR4 TaxID=3158265 RepID=UPI0034674464